MRRRDVGRDPGARPDLAGAPDPPSPERFDARELPFLWGRYELLEALGAGGFSTVFLADLLGPEGFRKPVALKVLRVRENTHADHRAAWLEEARLGARLHHPGVVEVYDLGERDGHLFIAMEWVRGPTVRTLLREGGALPIRAALDLLVQVCRAAHHAHELEVDGQPLGVVHRDIKTSNILVTPDGRAKLADFGIALSIRSVGGPSMGTLGTMSPEQLRGDSLDRRSDVFALGAVLAEVVLGRLPWPSRSMPPYLAAMHDPVGHLQREGELARLDHALPGLGAVVARAVALAPEDRFPTASQLARQLTALRGQAPTGPPLADRLADLRGDPASGVPTHSWAPEDATAAVYHPPETNLVASPDPFVGRAAELEELRTRLFEHGLVTVIGAGGLGKTRLVRELGLASLSRWPGGVWFCDLSQATTPIGIVQTVARVLGVPLAAGGGIDDLVAVLGQAISARGQALIILDNFEQVAAHAGATLSRWRERAPRASWLVTSRERLRIEGEATLVLGALSRADAVDLFVQRGERAVAGYAPATDDRSLIARLVDALDGMPLAIELAAARLRLLPLEHLLEAVQAPLDRLRSDRRDRPSRHTTLRHAIEGSWDLLEDWERAAFAQLSVFEAPFSVDAAVAVMDLDPWPGAPWGLFVVEGLLDKSLLRTVPGGSNGELRLAMYVALRAYASERLATAGALETPRGAAATGAAAKTAAEARHGRWMISSRAAGERTAEALADLVAAADRAVDRGESALAAEAALAAVAVVQRVGPIALGVAVMDRVLRVSGHSDRARVRLLIGRATLQFRSGEGARADPDVALALPLARQVDDPVLLSQLRVLQGQTASHGGDLKAARAAFEEALAQARRSGDPRVEAVVLTQFTQLAFYEGRNDASLEMALRAQAIQEAAGEREPLAASLGVVATVLMRLGRLEESELAYGRALAVQEAIGATRIRASTLSNLGYLLLRCGRLDESERIHREVVPILMRVGDIESAIASMLNLASVLLHQGRAAEARELCDDAAGQLADGGTEAFVEFMHASLDEHSGDVEAALVRLERAAALLRRLGPPAFLIPCLTALARLRLERGDVAAARAAVEEAILHASGRSGAPWPARLYLVRAELRAHVGDAPGARADLLAAEALADPGALERVEVLTRCGELCRTLGSPDEGRRLLAEAEACADAVEAPARSRMRTRIARLRAALELPGRR